MGKKIESSEITPESVYLNRRNFLRTSIYAGTALATTAIYRHFQNAPPAATDPLTPVGKSVDGETLTSFHDITNYNNFYEFSTDKQEVARRAQLWNPSPWTVAVGGLVAKPRSFALDELLKFGQEERIYRFRCVEGWSMVIPWLGFPLAPLLRKVEPTARARYVAFTSYYDNKEMQSSRAAGIEFPYVEGLRLDEAMHPLTLIATGLYGKPMPNQNGAPLRLVVPWKYGFKSIKSVVKIELTENEPPTTWKKANSYEYGFYSNVNPHVDHPRWSQARERRIGESGLRPTLMFNGYEDEVASLYKGMDLQENY